MKLDLHIHSSGSSDAKGTAKEIVQVAKRKGLGGIAITDHNEIRESLEAHKLAKELKDFVVICGLEITTSAGHILAYGINEKIPRDLSPEETIERIEALSGIAVVPHPYRFWSGIGENTAKKVKFSAIETINSRSTKRGNEKALRLAEKLKLSRVGGSDSHTLEHIGDAGTEFELQSIEEDDLIHEIVKGRIKPYGKSRVPLESLGYVYSCVTLWLKRGLKRI